MVVIYLAIAVPWILFSGLAVKMLVPDPELRFTMETVKGWFFVCVTAGLLYLALRREIGIYRDAMGNLRKSRQELLDILDAMPAGVMLLDGDAVEYININFSEQFGYALDEIATDPQWFMLAYPDPGYRQEVEAMRRREMERLAERNKTAICPLELKVACKNGQSRHVIVNGRSIDRRFLVIFTDITERELLHNELVKVQKLESIGALAGGIAHDFNNILTGIMGNLSCARMVLEPGHPAHSTLELAEGAARRAAELTRQLLTFAQGGCPVKKVLDVRRLIDEAAAMMLRGTTIRGDIHIEETVRLIEADAEQMAQVLNNVIANAVQAMPAGGTLRINADNARLAADNTMALPEGDYVRIVVADEGEGIPEAIRARIFDPFFTTKETGSGLGLAAAHSIVNRHGGAIGIEPAADRGTVCTIFLPATAKTLPEAPPASPGDIPPVRSAERPSILVMDDETIIRNLAATMLTHLGYATQTCVDGAEAVRLYAEALEAGAPFAAVLMDLTVPGSMGGLEAAHHILALDADARLIVSSGYSHDPVMAEYRSHGFASALAKPYTMANMKESLGEAFAAAPR